MNIIRSVHYRVFLFIGVAFFSFLTTYTAPIMRDITGVTGPSIPGDTTGSTGSAPFTNGRSYGFFSMTESMAQYFGFFKSTYIKTADISIADAQLGIPGLPQRIIINTSGVYYVAVTTQSPNAIKVLTLAVSAFEKPSTGSNNDIFNLFAEWVVNVKAGDYLYVYTSDNADQFESNSTFYVERIG